MYVAEPGNFATGANWGAHDKSRAIFSGHLPSPPSGGTPPHSKTWPHFWAPFGKLPKSGASAPLKFVLGAEKSLDRAPRKDGIPDRAKNGRKLTPLLLHQGCAAVKP